MIHFKAAKRKKNNNSFIKNTSSYSTLICWNFIYFITIYPFVCSFNKHSNKSNTSLEFRFLYSFSFTVHCVQVAYDTVSICYIVFQFIPHWLRERERENNYYWQFNAFALTFCVHNDGTGPEVTFDLRTCAVGNLIRF